MATTAHTRGTASDAHEGEDTRRIREAIASLDRGEGMVLTDEELETIRREVEDLDRRGVQGGSSPTLERRIVRHRQLLEERRAAAGG